MTTNNTAQEQARMARLASVVTCLVLLVFFVGGEWILRVFSVTVPAFQIAGGLLLLAVAMDMLRARQVTTRETPEEQAAGTSKEDIAITPLAVPMLAGPGAITTVILLSSFHP